MLRWKGINYLNFTWRNFFYFYFLKSNLHYIIGNIYYWVFPVYVNQLIFQRPRLMFFFSCFNLSCGELYQFCLNKWNMETFCTENKKIIENSIGWKGPLEVVQTNLLLQAGLLRSGYSGPVWVCMKFSQPFWAPASSGTNVSSTDNGSRRGCTVGYRDKEVTLWLQPLMRLWWWQPLSKTVSE